MPIPQSISELINANAKKSDGKPLPPKADGPDIPAKESQVQITHEGTRSGEGSGGIDSPLTEGSFAARQWHPQQTLQSTDGVFVLRPKFIKQATFTDSRQRQIIINFADKPATP